MAFAVMGVAQDVYSAGYFTNSSGNKQPAVYLNGSRLHYFDNASYNYEATDVTRFNGDTYWSFNHKNSDNNYTWAAVYKNGTRYLDLAVLPSDNSGLKINAMTHGVNYVFAAGSTVVDGVQRFAIWRGSETTPICLSPNTSYMSEALCVTVCDGWCYAGGYQYTSGSTYHGAIWKGDNTELYSLPEGFYIRGIACYRGHVYSVGTGTVSGTWTVKVFEDNHELYNLYSGTSSGGYAYDLYVDAGDIYVTGWEGSNVKVWKNGQSFQTISTSGSFSSYAVEACSSGVYCAGYTGGSNGKVWKNGSVLYSPTGCNKINGIYVEEECEDSDVRSLPFTETFENGNTSWPCWTVIDVDNHNGTNESTWMRNGKRMNPSLPTGNHAAMHWKNTDNSQEGWLVTPRLFLQPGQDYSRLVFKSLEGTYSSGSVNLTVWVSTNSDPTNTSSYTQVWSQTSPQNNWHQNTVSLSDYQGEAIYIAFKYVGISSVNWSIDDVTVEEGFQPCTGYSAPYSFDFSNGFGSCFTALDLDMSGGQKCWKPYSSESCIYHPYGQSGVAQTGWLFSTRVNLPTGNYNYMLSFKTKSTSSGTGRKNTAWIAVDKTGAHVPADYTTKIWEDANYSNSWTTIEVDLTQYKGHTVSIGFKYEGTYAHNWYVDDFAITQETAQYTITANSNNTNWGTVSGGGTYASGATCTLTATANSGYHFESWKKNGTVVSTSASYSFTVTENATYTAYFAVTPVTYYEITTNVTPSGAGTVNGGGTYPEGATVTLTANANNGYTFDHWQDGNTENPRTITVTGNATYTATFTQDTYTITVNANPPAGGSVTGGGPYHYGETATLTATANSGYEFAGWQDGNTENPRAVTVTGNATYTATFSEVGTTYFSVTANVSPAGAGTVSGTGTYEAGTVIVLTANANPGYTFDHWNDGSTSNPRTVTVNNDLSFTAYFTHNSYTVTVNASPSNAGAVSGGGSYYYGDYATLTATAYSGYEFVGWSDGSSENPHQVLVTGNATYTATFSTSGTTYYTVSAYVSPAGAGTVSGTGTFPAGGSTTLTANANPGYTFDHWNDGSTTNPRTITVNNNMSFTAYFNTEEYTITTNVTPAGSGSVTGGGTYPYGATATLTATPNSGYEFLQWSDGDLQNPRMVTVTGNATYTALFTNGSGDMFTLTVTSAQPLLGQVFGGGTYPAGSTVEIRALPATYARFVQWNDGNTENPRTVVVDSDMEFVAEFATTQNYTITVESADPERGQAFGGGSYQEGSEIQIAAVALGGYMFEKWQDGNVENPRTIVVTGNATYTAYFVENTVVTYTVTLICNTSEGTVSGGGTYISGTQATIQAFPNPGYVFTQWDDGNTENPRTFTVTGDVTRVAFFATGVGENEQSSLQVYPNPAKESIRILGLETNTEVEIYNSLGELVKVLSVGPDQEIGIRDLASGLYLVRCGNVMLRFVKEQ